MINPYRLSADAESLNPRAYELAACGVLQVSDPRAELRERFHAAVPTYETAVELEQVVRYYLAHPEERAQAAALAQRLVQGETFDRRVETLIECLETAALAQV